MEGRLRAAGILEFGGLEAGASEAPFRFVDSLPMIGEIDKAKGTFTAFGIIMSD
jgi:hypothetical protein